MLVRLQKFLSEAGVASRRASEEIIQAGLVSVNGRPVRELGTKVDPAADEVRVDGKAVALRRKLYLALNKPKGVVCSRSDPHKRRQVHDLLPAEWRNVYTVGRLDMDTEGLIFLTNDGDFSLRLTHPRYGIQKKYIAVVSGTVDAEAVRRVMKGVYDEGELLRAEKARVLKTAPTHSVIEVIMTEGKNREVRRLFESQGLEVRQLKRTQIGPIKLGELPSGRWRTLSPVEVKTLLNAHRPTKTEE